MNAAEHIVDSYFRIVRGCFTLGDQKVLRGNNRQLDLLAHNLKSKACFHVEVGVTHRENWCPTIADLEPQFEKKFFGAPPKRKGRSSGTTDYEKGKSYWPQIKETYRHVGFDPRSVRRVWVCWMVKGHADRKPINHSFNSPHLGQRFSVEVIGLRDIVLPALQEAIGTANYDDEILRTLGFVKQQLLQSNNG